MVELPLEADLGETIRSADEELAELEPESDVDVVFDGSLEQLQDLQLFVVRRGQALFVVDPEEAKLFQEL